MELNSHPTRSGLTALSSNYLNMQEILPTA
jgi:hypothetical protein